MKILVLATAEQKEELMAHTIHTDATLVWIDKPADLTSDQQFDACIDLGFENSANRIQWLNDTKAPLIVINSVITSLQEIKEPFIRINGWNTFLKRPIIEAACEQEVLKEKATSLFLLLGRKTEWVDDVTGFISPRIVASIINEAYMTLEENVSVEEEIDIAMKMGTNYPYGPFEWAKRIGLSNVFYLLETLSKQQSRYLPCKLLQQNVLA